MSESLEAEVKTKQGDPITSVALPKVEAKKDPHAEARSRLSSVLNISSWKPQGKESLLPVVRPLKRLYAARTSTSQSPIQSHRRVRPCSSSVCCMAKVM